MAPGMLPAAVLVFLLALGVQQSTGLSQISLGVARNLPTGNGPKTVTTSDQVSSSLLASGTPVSLWGRVRPEDVWIVCQETVAAGSSHFIVSVFDSQSYFQEDLDIQIENIRGCEQEADGSGFDAEALLIDNYDRKSVLVCSTRDDSGRCAIYETEEVIQELDEASTRRSLRFCFICANGCFPGDAEVQMANGDVKQMAEMNIGDEVAVRKPDGRIAYESVYAFGHNDAEAISVFVKITVAPVGTKLFEEQQFETRSVELTAGHFVPTSSGVGGRKILHKRAQDIKVGDTTWVSTKSGDQENLVPYIVVDVTTTVKQGLYNPLSMAGTIVVNGVVTSVHSEWFLDGMFDNLGLTHLLPAAYQVVLSPPRMLYRVMGKNLYTAVYTWLDVHFNLDQLVSDYSGAVTSISLASAVATPLCMLLLSNKKHTS